MVIDLAYFEGESSNKDFRFVRIKIIFGLEIDGIFIAEHIKFWGRGEGLLRLYESYRQCIQN